jgi:hypothetical protein
MGLLYLMIISYVVLIGFLAWLSYLYRADLPNDIRRIKLRNCTIGIVVSLIFIVIFGLSWVNQF